MATIDPPQPNQDAFHSARSKCLDSFVACESEVAHLMDLVSSGASADSLGHRVVALRKAKASPTYAAAKKTKVDALLDQLTVLIEFRNVIVHSKLRVVWIDSLAVACLVNAGQQTPIGQIARLFTLEDFRDLRAKTNLLANHLHQQVVSISKPAKPIPPSSPQPPSPDAKVGP